MIQQTARPISLEMALRDMIAAGYKVQLSAEASDWFDDLYARMDTELITHETLGLSVEFLDSERLICLSKGDEFNLVVRNERQNSLQLTLQLTLYKEGAYVGSRTVNAKEYLWNQRLPHATFKQRVNRALEGALGGTPC